MMAKLAILRTPPIRAGDSWDISSIDTSTGPLYASLSNSTLRHTLAPP
jgi:hypothetical protein